MYPNDAHFNTVADSRPRTRFETRAAAIHWRVDRQAVRACDRSEAVQ